MQDGSGTKEKTSLGTSRNAFALRLSVNPSRNSLRHGGVYNIVPFGGGTVCYRQWVCHDFTTCG